MRARPITPIDRLKNVIASIGTAAAKIDIFRCHSFREANIRIACVWFTTE